MQRPAVLQLRAWTSGSAGPVVNRGDEPFAERIDAMRFKKREARSFWDVRMRRLSLTSDTFLSMTSAIIWPGLLRVRSPAYSMLFHEYINNFTGNGVCLAGWFDRRKSPQFLQFRMAYSFISGEVLSVTLKKHGEIHWSWVCDWEEDGPDQEILQELIGNLNDMRRGAAMIFWFSGACR